MMEEEVAGESAGRCPKCNRPGQNDSGIVGREIVFASGPDLVLLAGPFSSWSNSGRPGAQRPWTLAHRRRPGTAFRARALGWENHASPEIICRRPAAAHFS